RPPAAPVGLGNRHRFCSLPAVVDGALPAPPVNRSTAATTAAGAISSRQGCPGIGQSTARLSAQTAPWSPSTTVGTPCGAHRVAGTTGANRLTTGVPTAAARWAAPVL